MATRYTNHLRIIAPSNKGEYEGSVAQTISQEWEKACPDIGPDNISNRVYEMDADENAKPIGFAFSAPTQPRHVTAFKKTALHKSVGVKYWESDRAGDLKEKFDNPTPSKATVSDASVLVEAGVKMRVETLKA